VNYNIGRNGKEVETRRIENHKCIKEKEIEKYETEKVNRKAK